MKNKFCDGEIDILNKEDFEKKSWTNNTAIYDRIAQNIDDLFYAYKKKLGLELSFDLLDKVVDNVKTVAFRRF